MSQTLETILRTGVVAVLRAESPKKLINVAHALSKGGVEAIEVTMTVPGALDVIQEACGQMAGVAVIGAGTVLDAQTARAAILAGAEYIVAPTVNALMHFCGGFPSGWESRRTPYRVAVTLRSPGSQATRRSRGWLRTLGRPPQKPGTLNALHNNARDAKTVVQRLQRNRF